MFISNLKIKNFRNIGFANIDLGEKINFFIGENAQGKTNIIESIYTSAFLKSFRTQKREDLIKDGESESKIDIKINNFDVNNYLTLYLSRKCKELKLNGKKPDSYKYLNVIIFYPDETNYISNFPYFRRNLIDRSIFYVNYSYINVYKKYYRCLKQRNIYIKSNKNEIDNI